MSVQLSPPYTRLQQVRLIAHLATYNTCATRSRLRGYVYNDYVYKGLFRSCGTPHALPACFTGCRNRWTQAPVHPSRSHSSQLLCSLTSLALHRLQLSFTALQCPSTGRSPTKAIRSPPPLCRHHTPAKHALPRRRVPSAAQGTKRLHIRSVPACTGPCQPSIHSTQHA